MNDALKGLDFTFEKFVKQRLGIDMDGSMSGEVCKLFLKGHCPRGPACPQKHSLLPSFNKAEKSVVCKHWLRGLCKKNDNCEFLHEYNLKKMPECWFFSEYGECSNPECLYLHIDPSSKIRTCPWYTRGFCKHGPLCKNKHIRNTACMNYLTGFCPLGPKCEYGHSKYELPAMLPSTTYH